VLNVVNDRLSTAISRSNAHDHDSLELGCIDIQGIPNWEDV